MKPLPQNVEAFLTELADQLADGGAEDHLEIVREHRASFKERQLRGEEDLLADYPSALVYAQQFYEEQPDDARSAPSKRALSWPRAALTAVTAVPLALAMSLLGTMLLSVGVAKLFVAERAGYFVNAQGDFIHFGILADTSSGKELFGWFGVPLFVVSGIALAIAAYLLVQRAFKWSRPTH